MSRRRDRPRLVLSAAAIGSLPDDRVATFGFQKGLKVEAVGESLVPCPGVMKGSLSKGEFGPRWLLTGTLTGVVADVERGTPFRRRLDFVTLSSAEKVVNRVSGVPFKDSAPPLDERGEAGLNGFSREWAMARGASTAEGK